MNAFAAGPLFVVDVGNTAIKIGRLPQPLGAAPVMPEAEFRTPAHAPDFDRLQQWLGPHPGTWFVASVFRHAATQLSDWLKTHCPDAQVQMLTWRDFPLSLDLESPERVGLDRLASAVAANSLRPADRPAVVVDAGSAITVDALDARGTFLGGAILPGLKMLAHALSADTDLLPTVNISALQQPPAIVGRNTEQAISSGIYWGAVGSIRQVVERVEQVLPAPAELFLTGGDMPLLAQALPRPGRLIPQLVLAGIGEAARACLRRRATGPATYDSC